MNEPIRVLVVDDSAFMRRLITSILSAEPDIEVIGQARDGSEALQMVTVHRPNVITLDVEMPGVDGFQALESIMRIRPTPVVMLSSLTKEGAAATIKCLQLGAVDFVAKPSGSISLDLDKVGADLVVRVRAAAGSRVRPHEPGGGSSIIRKRTTIAARPNCVFIGTSTGGPRALQQVIPKLPKDLGVPVVVVQHMPSGFTHALAERLDAESNLHVVEATPGVKLEQNSVYIAPGGFHMEFTGASAVRLFDAPSVHGVRPSADVTLESLVGLYRETLVGVILTGMGRDGAASMKLLHDAGGVTLVEAESTCVVYGMPRAVVEIGAADLIVPLPEIAHEIARAVKSTRANS